MDITSELERLSKLQKDGALTADEFARAKQALLIQLPQSVSSSTEEFRGSSQIKTEGGLGNAAERYVTFQMVMQVIVLIIGIIFFFAFFLPNFKGTTNDLVPHFKNGDSLPSH